MEESDSGVVAEMVLSAVLPRLLCHRLQHDLEEFFALRVRTFNAQCATNVVTKVRKLAPIVSKS
jgi:hypothetical protein